MRNACSSPAVSTAMAFVGVLLSIVVPAEPARANVLTFQQGDGGSYSTTDATFIVTSSSTNYGIVAYLSVSPSGTQVSFVRFPDFIGNNAGQVPPMSTITSASIELTNISGSGGATVHEVLSPWDAADGRALPERRLVERELETQARRDLHADSDSS